jgi:hypothetical protein
MARRPSKHLRPARPLRSGHATTERKTDGVWVVRDVTGQSAVKSYRCPGCDHIVQPGSPHVVVWPHEPGLGSRSPLDERRHWHTACWRRRP